MTEIYSVLGLEEVDYRQNFVENNILTKNLEKTYKKNLMQFETNCIGFKRAFFQQFILTFILVFNTNYGIHYFLVYHDWTSQNLGEVKIIRYFLSLSQTDSALSSLINNVPFFIFITVIQESRR